MDRAGASAAGGEGGGGVGGDEHEAKASAASAIKAINADVVDCVFIDPSLNLTVFLSTEPSNLGQRSSPGASW